MLINGCCFFQYGLTYLSDKGNNEIFRFIHIESEGHNDEGIFKNIAIEVSVVVAIFEKC